MLTGQKCARYCFFSFLFFSLPPTGFFFSLSLYLFFYYFLLKGKRKERGGVAGWLELGCSSTYNDSCGRIRAGPALIKAPQYAQAQAEAEPVSQPERQGAETRHVRSPTNRPITPHLTAARNQSICREGRVFHEQSRSYCTASRAQRRPIIASLQSPAMQREISTC